MGEKPIDHIELKLPAKAEYVGVVRLTVSGIASRAGYSYDDIEDLKIAVAEACTNVVDHAYQDSGLIGIGCSLYTDKMVIVVADNGQSFDLEKLKEGLGPVDGTKPIGELEEGGLGLFLIDSLMDKVEINGKAGVAIVMTKFLQRDEVEQNADGVPAPTNAQKQ
ncbi:serine/threonine-protein kinase RsbW [Alteribacillus persepolensis]|uniref:Serine-protein kinase RsbW n=1 Tax=Alteribacillus persepolensis TaxID=568899 RepID=A0A1G8FFI9_9BACI|nr:serine/threonine-protein kinase RsbW [Alteribacillus persepolensis]